MTAIVTLTMNPTVDLSTAVERLEPGHKLRCAPAQRTPGGGGVNVARGLARLGADALALVAAGGDQADLLERLLEEEGLARRLIPVTGPVRESFAVEVQADGALYHFVLPGPELAESDWRRCLDMVAELDPAPDWLVASGSLPGGVPADFYGRLAQAVRGRDGRLVLDASGEALRGALGAGIHLLRMNRRELEGLTGRSLDDPGAREAEVRALVRDGAAEVVVVSLEAEGAVACTAERWLEARPPPVEGRSPVGAGDSFVALLVHRLASGHDLADALDHAVAAAAAAVTTPGSELYRGDEIGRLVRRMREEGQAAGG